MAVFQIEQGAATGVGFSSVNANGWLAKFYTWVTKAAGAGGPGWTILQDKSASASFAAQTFTVNTQGANNILTYAPGANQAFLVGEIVRVSNSGGALPTGLSAATDYFVYPLSATTFRIFSTMLACWTNANLTGVNISSNGSGTNSVTMEGPYITVSDRAAPSINQACMIMKIGYRSALDTNLVRVQQLLGYDVANNIIYGYWAGFNITTSSSAFTYDFRGGAQCMILQSLVSSVWYTVILDTFTGDSNFLEPVTATGTLASGVSAGSNVVLTLGAGQTANFTVNKYYYIYDISTQAGSGHAWVNYCKCTAINAGANQITVDTTSYAYPTGSIIAAYAHRFYCNGSYVAAYGGARMIYSNPRSLLPYYSSQFGVQNCSAISYPDTYHSGGWVYGRDSITMLALIPDDLSYYVCQHPMIIEYADNIGSTTVGYSQNRYYGITNNLYETAKGTMTINTDGKTVNAVNWLYFQTENLLTISNSLANLSTLAILFCNTASAS